MTNNEQDARRAGEIVVSYVSAGLQAQCAERILEALSEVRAECSADAIVRVREADSYHRKALDLAVLFQARAYAAEDRIRELEAILDR
jgi:hypothetical protein